MTSFWAPQFEFYEARAGSGRAFVTIDLAAASRAPLASHPIRLQLRVKMQAPRPDGLRADEEADALFALEDQLERAIREKADGIYVGRVVTQGFTEFFFYGPALQQNKLDAPHTLVGDTRPYTLEWYTEADPEWSRYHELFPNPWAWQSIMNRRLLRSMREQGDALQVARQIDHLAYFETETQAKQASTALQTRGFSVTAPRAPTAEHDGWALAFQRVDACDSGKPDLFVSEILDIVVPLEGDYDGWGSLIQRTGPSA